MTPPAKITAPQFTALCALLWGDDWRAPAASALAVSPRNVQHWAAGSKAVPPGVIGELFALVVARLAEPDGPARLFLFVADRVAQLRILFQATGFELRDFPANR